MDPNNRPAQLDSPAVGRVIKYGSRLNTRLYRLTGGRLGNRWRVGAAMRKPVPVCLLTTTGRKSGEARTVPLLYLRHGESIVLVASQGGLPANPAWYHNLKADPAVRIQIDSDAGDYAARIADDAERTQLWPSLVELYADFDTYAAWTERTIPVIICEPA
ncbi:nitroreductase family deazaflavin-dependent oxidoreductase [Gordonia liuliyuniae]|uniref:Nitroreductase family deazaflavin-dependent oxidoreductase n=1 Tax=Gordonia liuliyuniae TaxID=2911517 RepID=A0ABS9IVR2_9ACTN|nr:nitroreductase family deazaflavin-dependent oxidoreductase [Gordonia liuliyuniae]MCF8589572.1 nitroreductase family deazaflavin-dependent oxidoreductase [Gordonia liuliyuniae]